MCWCTAVCIMLLFCAKTVAKVLHNFELASLKKKKEKRKEKRKKIKKKKEKRKEKRKKKKKKKEKRKEKKKKIKIERMNSQFGYHIGVLLVMKTHKDERCVVIKADNFTVFGKFFCIIILRVHAIPTYRVYRIYI